MQTAALCRLKQHLCAEVAGPLGHRCGDRIVQRDISRRYADQLPCFGKEAHGGSGATRFGAEQGLMDKGRKYGSFAFLKQVTRKAVKVLRLQRKIQGMGGKLRLHEDCALRAAASGPSRDLHQLCKKAFCSTKIMAVEHAVSIENRNQSDLRKIMPFRQHLRANEYIDRLFLYLLAHTLPRIFAPCRVTINA